MKKLLEIVFGVLLLFASIACFSSCKSNAISGEWVPNGDVCSYTDTIYQAKESFGDVSKGTLLSIEKHFLNENNMDTLLVLYTPDGKEEKRVNSYYDSNGDMVKQVEYSYREDDNDFWGKSVNEITNTTIYSYVFDGGKKLERKAVTYRKMYSEGVDSCSFNNEYEKRTDYDTLCSVTVYKYEIPKVVDLPKNDDDVICYLGANNEVLMNVETQRKTKFVYNQYHLPTECIFEEEYDEQEYSSEKSLFEYEYDSKDNPVVVRCFKQGDNNRRIPDTVCLRHYDYK